MLQVWPVFEEIEHMFRAVLREYGPLRLTRVSWFRQDIYSPNVAVRGYWHGRTDDGQQEFARVIRFNTLEVIRRGRLSGLAFNLGRDREGDLDYQSLWSRMAEDFRMQQASREQDDALRVLAMAAPSMQAFEQVQMQARTLREHVERNHNSFSYDYERDGWRRYGEGFEFSARDIALNTDHLREHQQRAIREMSQHFDRMALNLLQGRTTTTTTDAATDQTISVESVRQALETLSRNISPDEIMYGGGRGGDRSYMTYYERVPHRWVAMDWGFPDVGTKEARDKGKKLLLEHLSPEQKSEYETTQAFTVTAPSGTRYRIREGRQMNIDVLDEHGSRKSGICFLPEGQLVAGDCMLAQKIALETCEDLALSVANKFS